MVLGGVEVESAVGDEPGPGNGSSGVDRRALLALAKVDGRRLARQPLIVAGLLLSTALFWRETAMDGPVLQRDSVYLAKALLPLAVAAMFATNLLGLRDRRLGSEEMLSGLRHDAQTRWAARSIAALAPVIWGGILLAVFLAVLAARDAVGSPAWPELAVGLALVGCASLVGLGLARWAPTPIAPAVGLASLVVTTLLLEGDGTSRSRWLAPYVDFATRADAIELARRPVELHLVALVGVGTALAVLVAFRRSSIRSLAVLVAIAVAVTAGALQLTGASGEELDRARAFALEREHLQRCETGNRARVCLYPGYLGWADDYLTSAESVLKDLPIGDLNSRLTIEQRVPRLPLAAYPTDVLIDVNTALSADRPPNTVFVGMSKAGGATGLDFRSAVGMWAVGLPPSPQPGDRLFATEDDARGGHPPDVYCAAADSRPALGLWLAVRDDPSARKALDQLTQQAVDSANTTGIYLITAGGVIVEPRQAQLAARLATLPQNEVASALSSRWDALRSGELSADDLGQALNLDVSSGGSGGGLPDGVPTPPPCS